MSSEPIDGRARKVRIEVSGMHCRSCQMLVAEELEDAGAKDIVVRVDAPARTGIVDCVSSLSESRIKEIIESAGDYTVTRTELR